MSQDQSASAKADRATRASPEPASGLGQKASVPCAERGRRKWPTGLPLVDKLRSCMLQNVPHNQTDGTCSFLPYEAAEQIHDLYDALTDTLSVCEYVLSKGDAYDEQFGQLVHAHVDTAKAALAKARGQ